MPVGPLPAQLQQVLTRDLFRLEDFSGLNVLSTKKRRHVATINHGFEPSPLDPAQTFLDPLNPQSDLAPRLLEFVKEQVLKDEDYVARLHRHYRMFKDVVNDPRHPSQTLLRRLPSLPLNPLQRRRRR